jgi:dTDP-4-dehydrorhamnose reductase
MMRLLVTGASGKLGSILCNLSQHENFGIYNTNLPPLRNTELVRCDILDRSSLFDVVKRVRPDVVVHTAGIVGIDVCERARDSAWNTNVTGTKNVCDACRDENIPVTYLSTSYIFDGRRGNYRESDTPNPNTWYGKTKLVGEFLAGTERDNLIVRCSHIYGKTHGFLGYVVDSLKNGREIHIVKDNYFSPTMDTEVAKFILKLVESHSHGVYNASSKRMSRMEFAQKIADKMKIDGKISLVTSLDNSIIKNWDHSLDASKASRMNFHFSELDTVLNSDETFAA